MKKKLKLLLTSIVCLVLFMPALNASSAYFYVTPSRKSLVVGNTFNVTVSVNADRAIGTVEYNLVWDSSKVSLVSGDDTWVVDYGDGSSKSKTYYYTFKSIASGTSTISVQSYLVRDYDSTQPMNTTGDSTTVSAVTQAELEASYSKNNNLSSITVEGYNLEPEFNKDTLEYKVSVPSNIEKVKINASVEDYTASVSGTGEMDVSEGENKFTLTVTAQNGSVKTYTVKVNVEDLNPIEVIVDGQTYTVIKRANSLTGPSTFTETTVKIGEIEVPAFYSEITDITLVGLKNLEGEQDLFVYDSKTNKYTLYKEIKTSGLTIYPLSVSEVPILYTPTEITINNEKVKAYIYENDKDYYIVYGLNIENNDEGFFMYDVKNNSFIKYDQSIIKDLSERNKNYFFIIVVLGLETLVVTMLLLIMFTKNSKRKRKALKYIEEKRKAENKED